MELDPTNPKLYLQQVDILTNSLPMDVPQVVALFDKDLDQEMPDKHKLLFSQRKVEFLEDFGTEIIELQTTKTNHVDFTNKVNEAMAKEKSGSPGAAESKNGSSTPAVSNSSS
jgi:pre-mRNA-processing factor 39